MRKAILSVSALALFATGQAQAAVLQVIVDGGAPITIPVTPDPNSDISYIGNWSSAEGRHVYKWQNGEAGLEVSGHLDPDPMIAYGIAVTDFGAPSSFQFLFSSPIVPTAAPTVVDASITGGLTDATGNGVSITPLAILGDPDGDTIPEVQIATTGNPAQNMGVDVGLGQIHAAGPAGANYPYGPYFDGPQAGPALGPYTMLELRVGFTLSGSGDIAALTGFGQINTVPEPISASFLLLGAMLLNRRARA